MHTVLWYLVDIIKNSFKKLKVLKAALETCLGRCGLNIYFSFLAPCMHDLTWSYSAHLHFIFLNCNYSLDLLPLSVNNKNL